MAEIIDGVASLTLVTRGTHIVSCEGVDEPVRDEIGVAIDVSLAGAYLGQKPPPSAEELPAGAPFDITRSLEDAFGNRIERLSELPAESSLHLGW